MASTVEPVAKSPAVGCFAKVHDVFTLTSSSNEKSDPDFPSSVSKNPNGVISSSCESAKASSAPDMIGTLDRPDDFYVNVNSQSDGSDQIQDDGPSTPMCYLSRPVHAHSETPDSADSLASLSLGTGSSFHVDREVVKREETEIDDDNLLSLSLSKTDGEFQSVMQSYSTNVPRALVTLGMSKISVSRENEIQQQNLCQHSSFLTHIPQACSTMNAVVSLQSSRNMSDSVKPTQCSSVLTNIKQETLFINNQQETETTVFPLINPRPLTRVPCTFRQPVSSTFGVVQCEDTLQRGQWKYKTAVTTTKQCYDSTTSSTEMEALTYMPMLQTPLVANIDRHRLVSNGDNLCLGNESRPMIVKKRKLDSHNQPGPDSTCALAEVNQCFLKAREQLEDTQNLRAGAERLCSIERQVKLMRSSHCDSMSKDCFKKHTLFVNKVGNFKPFNGSADLPSTNNIAKPGYLPASAALKLNGSGTINSSESLSHVSLLRSDVYSHCDSGLGKMSDNLSLETTKADWTSRGKCIEQTLDGQPHPLGLRLLTFPAYAPMPAALPTFSSGGPSLPQYMKHPGKFGDSHLVKKQTPHRTPSPDSDWGKFLGLSAAPGSAARVDEPDNESLLPYQKRFMHLQAFLKQCDEPDQKYLKNLRSLSAAARSGHAVDLETRAIMLSLEEGKELHRMKMLNVFAKDSPSSADVANAAPQGARLIVPVAPKALRLVSNP